MIAGEGSRVIHKPVREIYDFVLDPDRYRRADLKIGQVYSLRWLDDRSAEIHYSGRFRGWVTPAVRQIITVEPCRRIDVRSKPGTAAHRMAPLLLLAGFSPFTVGTATALYAGWAAFGHSNVRLDLRVLEPVFITPRLHRLHHVPATTERNFGTIFSIWDRLAGTLATKAPSGVEPIGVPGEIDSYPSTGSRSSSSHSAVGSKGA